MRESTVEAELPRWVHAGVLVVIGVMTLWVSMGMWNWSYDDSYIIYRYARNFADGLGMVYNLGQHYQGTTSAGYTLLLAGLYKLLPWLDMPVLSSLVSMASILVSGSLLWIMGLQARKPLAGFIAALFTVTNPLVVESWGGEMPLLLALVLGTVVCYTRGVAANYSRRSEALAGILLGLAVLTRLDSLVLVALLGGHYLLVRRKLPLIAGLSFVLTLLPWLIYSWTFFGSVVPETLEAKIAQGKAGWGFFLSGSLNLLNDVVGFGVSRPLVFGLVAIGGLALLLHVLRRNRWMSDPWVLVSGWAGLFTIGYTALRVAFYHWYAVPMSVTGGILLAWGVDALFWLFAAIGTRVVSLRRPVEGGETSGLVGYVKRRLSIAHLTAGVIAVLVLGPVAAELYRYDSFFAQHVRLGNFESYRQTGDWLKEHVSPSSSAAYPEVGEIGYYSNIGIVDLVGLITPGVTAHVPYWDFSWAVLKYQPDYYLMQAQFEPVLRNISSEPWFKSAYEPVTTLGSPSRPRSQLTVFKRKEGANLPPPMRPVLIQRANQQRVWMDPDVPPDTWPGQSFVAPEANLTALALFIGKAESTVTGTAVLHLRQSPTATSDLRTVEVPVEQIVNNSWYTFRFEPVADSAGKSYFVTVELRKSETDTPDSPQLTLWYATDDLYPNGTRYDGPKSAVGDLCLRAWVLDSDSSR